MFWEDPYKGSATDEFTLDDTELVQVSSMSMKDSARDCSYRTVYTRTRHRVDSKNEVG